mgnify:CR=1 FL=1
MECASCGELHKLNHAAPLLICVRSQIKYVVEAAKALARVPSVARVDLLTRRICDPSVDPSYGAPEEPLKLPPMGDQPAVQSGVDGSMGGAYIVRLPCGPTNVYLRCVCVCVHTCLLWFVRLKKMLPVGKPPAVQKRGADGGMCGAYIVSALQQCR